MKCADPVLCYTDSKGKRIFRHFSLASKIFKEHLHNQVFDCGKCLFCRKKKAYELACRCVLHASLYKENCFLTLTYDEKKEGYHNEFTYSDIQKFKKRLRSHCSRTYGTRIEVFNVHEYGKNGKKHWHLVVFNCAFPDKTLHTMRNGIPYYISETLSRLWPMGMHTIGDVSEASAMYQAQYMEKDFKNRNAGTKKKSHSKHSGIARPYFEKHFHQILSLGYVPVNGKKLPVPRYFEKLAHRHYCHFYEKSAFCDTSRRKAVHRPFRLDGKGGKPNRVLADLYTLYQLHKSEKVQRLESEWNHVILQHLQTGAKPDFIKSAENALHDLRNKQKQEKF